MDNLMIRRTNGVVILEVSGELTLRDKVSQVMETGSARIVLNMAALTRIDTFGLGELVGAYASIVRAGGQMKLLSVSPKVMRMLDLTRLCTIFEIYEDEASAVCSFAESPACPPAAKRAKPGSEAFLG